MEFLFYWVIVPLIKIAVVMAVLPIGVAFLTYLERKTIAWAQVRIGPKRVGPQGLGQPFADVIKLLFKEDLTPAGSTQWLFILAPILSVVPAFVAVAVFPFGPEQVGWADKWYLWPFAAIGRLMQVDISKPIPLAIADLDIGLLFILAISSLGVFSILLAGWASNSKYPLLGGLRSAAQLISYEIPLGFALIAGLMMTRTLSMNGIIQTQGELGWSLIWLQPVSFIIYMIAGVAETNRVPFDLPEAETELVAGFHTEYSGMKFALFFLAEYINMLTVTVIAVTVFLGGWLPPLHGLWTWLGQNGQPHPWTAWMFTPILGLLWFGIKVCVLYYGYFALRATLPRYRYDQLMDVGWKFLIPLSMLNVLLVGVSVVLMQTRLGLFLREGIGLGNFVLVGFAVVNLLLLLVIVNVLRPFWRPYGKQVLRPAH